MGRRLTPRGRERREQLMEFATRRFAERGFHATSVADIVAGLGVGKGVFYWYFESKDQLFLEILRDAQRNLRQRQRDEIGAERDPVHRIEIGIRASMSWIAEHPYHNELIRIAAMEDRFRPYLARGEQVALADLTKHVDDAVRAGTIVADRPGEEVDADVIAQAILGVTQRLARMFLRDGGRSPTQIADEAVRFCLTGITRGRADPPAGGH